MQAREEMRGRIDRFKSAVDPSGKVNLPALVQETVTLFSDIKTILASAGEEEKKEVTGMVREIHDFLSTETKRLASKIGMNEKQLLQYAENPSNFSHTQWNALETIRSMLGSQAKELRQEIKRKTPKKGIL